MNLKTMEKNGLQIAVVNGPEPLLTDVQSALDLIASVQYETGSSRIAIHKAAIAEDFFNLRTRLAGEILQKFINYQAKLAIIGDFSGYTSKALHDFIYESNQGHDIFFVPDEESAIQRLAR